MKELKSHEIENVSGGHPIVAIIIYLGVRSVVRTVIKVAVASAVIGATTAAIDNATK